MHVDKQILIDFLYASNRIREAEIVQTMLSNRTPSAVGVSNFINNFTWSTHPPGNDFWSALHNNVQKSEQVIKKIAGTSTSFVKYVDSLK